mgnify:CR=1 FL=1
MASTNAKYYGENGIHRVPLWRIAGFAANNLATNMYLFLMGYVAYYLTGFVGVAVVTASSFSMAMRVWDGVTDPFIGYFVDKTNGKFGKNRPFMIIGQIILCVMSFILFPYFFLLYVSFLNSLIAKIRCPKKDTLPLFSFSCELVNELFCLFNLYACNAHVYIRNSKTCHIFNGSLYSFLYFFACF